MQDDLLEEKPELHLDLSSKSNIELFMKIVNEFHSLTIFAKNSVFRSLTGF